MNNKPQAHLTSIFNDNTRKSGAVSSLNGAVKHVLHKNPNLPEYKRRATYQTMVNLNEHPERVFNTKQTRGVVKEMGQAGMLQYKYKHNPIRALRHVQKVYQVEQEAEKKNLSPEEKEKLKNRNLAENQKRREEEETKEGLVIGREKGAIRSLGLEDWQEAKGSISQVLNQKKNAKTEPESESPMVDMVID